MRARSNSDENWLGASGPLSRVSRRRARRIIATKAFAGRARTVGRRQRCGGADRFGQTRPAAAGALGSRARGRLGRGRRHGAHRSPVGKPRIMTARAFTLPAETSIVLARKNSGEAQPMHQIEGLIWDGQLPKSHVPSAEGTEQSDSNRRIRAAAAARPAMRGKLQQITTRSVLAPRGTRMAAATSPSSRDPRTQL